MIPLHVLANMNEPREGSHSNVMPVLQDFTADEVQDGSPGMYYRGVVFFTCCDVQKGDELTWYYGRHYQQTRDRKGYVAGLPCAAVLAKEHFLPDKSLGVVRAYAGA